MGIVYITWAIERIFNMEEEEVSDNNCCHIYLGSLEIVQDSTDNILLDNIHLDTFLYMTALSGSSGT